jgi:hypothetical protein
MPKISGPLMRGLSGAGGVRMTGCENAPGSAAISNKMNKPMKRKLKYVLPARFMVADKIPQSCREHKWIESPLPVAKAGSFHYKHPSPL